MVFFLKGRDFIKQFIISILLFNFIIFYPSQAKALTSLVDTPGYLGKTYSAVIHGFAAVGATGLLVYEEVDKKSDQIKQHAEVAWNNASQTVKDGFRSSVLLAQQTGSNILSLSEEVLASLTLGLTEILTKLSVEAKEKGISDLYTVKDNSWSGGMVMDYTFTINDPTKAFKITTSKGASFPTVFNIRQRKDDGYRLSIKIGNSSSYTFSNVVPRDLTGTLPGAAISSLHFWNSKVSDTYRVTFDGIVTVSTGAVTTIDDSIYDNTLKRALENDIPYMRDAGLVLPIPEAFHPTTNKRINVDTKTGTMTLPDGTIYQGEVNWKTPNVVTQTDALGNPSVGWTGTDITTGDTTWTDIKTGETSTGVEVPPLTGEIDGFWAKLWDWLQKLLNGILAIPKAILSGLSALFIPTVALGTLFAPFTGALAGKFNTPDELSYIKGQTGLGCSVDDLKINLFGNSTTIVDVSFIKNASSWYLPIFKGLLWFFFGWYLYRKIVALINLNGGIKY